LLDLPVPGREPGAQRDRPTEQMTNAAGARDGSVGILCCQVVVSALVLLVARASPSAVVVGSAPTTTATASTMPSTASTVPSTTASSAPSRTTVAPTRVPATSPSTSVGASGAQGTVRFGPVCPVERIPPDPQCAPRPGTAHIQLLRASGGVAAEGDAGADGRFSISVGQGIYDVRARPPSPGPGRGCQAEPPQAKVVAGSFATVTVTCDTGIR